MVLLDCLQQARLRKKLCQAASAGDVAAIRCLLARGLSPSAAWGEKGCPACSALHWAALSNRGDAVRALLAGEGRAAELAVADSRGWTAAHVAARRGASDALAALLEAPGGSALLVAVDELRRTPLHIAAAHGHAGALELLLSAGAAPNSASRVGTTPLHSAVATARAGAAAVVQLLLGGGASPSAPDDAGDQPLHFLVQAWRPDLAGRLLEVAKVLLEAGADPLAPNRKGETPLGAATRATEATELWELLQAAATARLRRSRAAACANQPPAPPAAPALERRSLPSGLRRPPLRKAASLGDLALRAPLTAGHAAAAACAAGECVICADAAREVALVPCGHRCLCEGCCWSLMGGPQPLRVCPICRAQATGSLRVYDP